jgi:hypothetical protein
MTHHKKDKPQVICVFQQNGSGENKIRGIQAFGGDRFVINKISITESLPYVIDDAREYLPETIEADLVIDYLKHPDLSYDLAALCKTLHIPSVSTRKKIKNNWTHSPPICCALPFSDSLGTYGQLFGVPKYKVTIKDNLVSHVIVLRGAPCGATWDTVKEIIGLNVNDAIETIGIKTQFCCSADPADWDPLYGKSPVHLAADFHKKALSDSINQGLKRQ